MTSRVYAFLIFYCTPLSADFEVLLIETGETRMLQRPRARELVLVILMKSNSFCEFTISICENRNRSAKPTSFPNVYAAAKTLRGQKFDSPLQPILPTLPFLTLESERTRLRNALSEQESGQF